jgi:hypothetical protein
MAYPDPRSKAGVTVVHGHLKIYVNDLAALPGVLAQLSTSTSSNYQQIHGAAHEIRLAISAYLGIHCGTLRDALYHGRRSLPPGIFKRITALNSTDSFLRHSSSAFLSGLVDDVSAILAPGCNTVSPETVDVAHSGIIHLSLDDFIFREDIWKPLSTSSTCTSTRHFSHDQLTPPPTYVQPINSDPAPTIQLDNDNSPTPPPSSSPTIHHVPVIYDAGPSTPTHATLELNKTLTKTPSSGSPTMVIPTEKCSMLGGDFRSLPTGIWHALHLPFAATPTTSSLSSSMEFPRENSVLSALAAADLASSKIARFWDDAPVKIQVTPSCFLAFERFNEYISQFKYDLHQVSLCWVSLECFKSHLHKFTSSICYYVDELVRSMKAVCLENSISPALVP